MPIDYSKWDKIELSDDSDIEVHPNVDKNSFIKWKQRDIHEKRQQRNLEIKSILVQLTTYVSLNNRVDFLLENLSDKDILNDKVILEVLNKEFDPKEKFSYEKLKKDRADTLRKGLKDLEFNDDELKDLPPFNEMVEDLFTQVKEDHPEAKEDAAKLRQFLSDHRKKIDDILSSQSTKLDDLLYQKSMLISSEDIHTGFDRSFLNKEDNEEPDAPEPVKTKKEVVTSMETLNSPKAVDTPSKEESSAESGDDYVVSPTTAEFAKISSTDIDASASFLLKHTKICTEQQKDALIMTAFDYQLEGKSKEAKQVIHQSLLLQYIAQLAGNSTNKEQVIKAIKLFCSKIKDRNTPASLGFNQDVENTFNHIKTRCEVIKQEHESAGGEEEALIQLKALDDKTQLLVNIPEKGTKEYEIFTTEISTEMQKAVQTESLDEVNKVFAKMSVEEAEQVLEKFNECGVIGITDYLEDESQFKELQEHYNEELHNIEESSKPSEELNLNTADIVD